MFGTLDLGSRQAAERTLQDALESLGRVGEGEELLGVAVHRVAASVTDDHVEVGCEVSVRQSATEHIFPRLAGFRDRLQRTHRPLPLRSPPFAQATNLDRHAKHVFRQVFTTYDRCHRRWLCADKPLDQQAGGPLTCRNRGSLGNPL